jgi:hypothetical protein
VLSAQIQSLKKLVDGAAPGAPASHGR